MPRLERTQEADMQQQRPLKPSVKPPGPRGWQHRARHVTSRRIASLACKMASCMQPVTSTMTMSSGGTSCHDPRAACGQHRDIESPEDKRSRVPTCSYVRREVGRGVGGGSKEQELRLPCCRPRHNAGRDEQVDTSCLDRCSGRCRWPQTIRPMKRLRTPLHQRPGQWGQHPPDRQPSRAPAALAAA